MSEHCAKISWKRTTEDFAYENYSRDHEWRFESGSSIAASAAPEFSGNPKRVDPEEALVASLSSCHMLTFLALAARKRLVVDSYLDDAVGIMEKNEDGKLAITRVELRPRVEFGEPVPSGDVIERMHHKAHDHCFIANSVKTQVSVKSE
jgi:organic hydroperoxide reductase OsmC/OhrA